MSTTFSQTRRRSTVLEDSEDAQTVLEALTDPDCRAILEATREESLTATELSDRCDIPSSTAYRKVEALAAVDLLEERVRINTSSKHATEYRRRVDAVSASIDTGGLVVEMTPLEPDTETASESAAAANDGLEVDSDGLFAVADD
ncbi:winged helix-turn-helix domain-containing protein [Halostagnicola kamekurae]|uniref:Helix-turn-helix domain-containing protein n=1 Tax=Halostagnicola kamekurae TaxID=619731 RepID=A0A1I6TI05_9EURY|nr:helix-turn-helix domain-containing protein [Halostagnicola kamekurae]SFS88882.1 Helix-turn-helix domain-containing protein [Halostagnicola kamekurae]